MKYSNTTLRELSAQYGRILRKCALFNAMVLMGVAVAMPAMAANEAKIGDNEYATLAEAIQSVQGGSNNGAEISVIADVPEGKGVSVKSNSDFTVDFGGNTYTAYKTSVGSSGTETQVFQLLKDSTITLKNGTVNVADPTDETGKFKIGIQNYSNLTLDHMAIDGSNLQGSTPYTVSNNNGNILIKDSKIIAKEGGVAFDVYSWQENGYGDVSVAVENSDISGKIEVTTDDSAIGDLKHELTITGGVLGAVENGSKIYNEGTLTLNNVTLAGNSTTGSGAAIYNKATKTATGEVSGRGIVTVKNTQFNDNTAQGAGGAIANYGGTMTLAGAEFKGNTAGALGGAIYNDKDMTLDGTFSFSGNTDSTGANDIHNVGSLTLGGDITLDGGITGDGDITFKDGTTLKLQNAWDGSAPKITAGMVQNDGATLNVDLTIANGTEDATYAFVDAETWNGDALGLSDSMTNNTLYDITAEDGSIRVVKKAAEEAAATLAEAGMTGNQTNAVLAMTEAGSTGNDQADALLNKITSAAQNGDTETAGSLVNELQPLDVPMVQAVATNNAVLSAVTTRLANIGSAGAAVGRSGGDGRVSKLSPWVEGLYSKTHNSQGAGFDAYSQGFAFGADTDLNEDWTVGIGYAYTATDIKNAVRKTNVYGDNYFAYAQYKPSNWYVNAVLNYGHANYKEQGMMNHKYNVDTYGAQVLTGYEWNILNNYAGVRYTYIDTEKYNNGVTETDTKHAQVATAVIGTKVSKDFTVGKNVVFKPEFRLAGTYDFKSDNSTANVSIVGTPVTYSVNAKRLSRAAVETGVGLTATVRNLELSLNYDASFRSENNTQAGMFKIKYNF